MPDNLDLQARIERLESSIASVLADIAACVCELRADDGGRYLVMERLPRLGSASAASLQRLVASETDPEVRAMAALVALEVGDPSLADLLLAEIEARGSLAPLAARTVAVHKIVGSEASVSAALAGTDVADVDEIVAYLDALRTLGEELHEDERRRLQDGPWQVRSALADWFPSA